jgi:hypothetical protein
MIVEDQLDRRKGRIGAIEKLEEFNEFAAAVAILDQGMDLAGEVKIVRVSRGSSDKVRNPWAMVLPPGNSRRARSTST